MIACPHEGIITLDCKITKNFLILYYFYDVFFTIVIFVIVPDIHNVRIAKIKLTFNKFIFNNLAVFNFNIALNRETFSTPFVSISNEDESDQEICSRCFLIEITNY